MSLERISSYKKTIVIARFRLLDNIRKNHHYVSQSYLKAWANNHHRIWVYRLLVSHSSVPEWEQSSIKSIANHQHLFTRNIMGRESDEFEKWMDKEIESPAQIALLKARSHVPLNKHELEHLLRFVALHDIRSPESYIEHLTHWREEMPSIVEGAMQSAISKIEAEQYQTHFSVSETNPDSEMIPMRVTKEIEEKSEVGLLKTEVLLGRGLWLFSIRHLLSNTYKVLNKHVWSILHAPEGMEWITSDNPVLKLNYYKAGSYDFKGGWGNKGSEIIFPISPELLLYTQVGNNTRINTVSRELATELNRFIAENAHRHVFGSKPIAEISGILPRTVDKVAFDGEKREWEAWHERQKESEKGYQK